MSAGNKSTDSAIYKATEHIDTLTGDTRDHTSIRVEVGEKPKAEPSPDRCTGSSVITLLAHSSTVRYILAIGALGLLIFFLERVLGAAVPQDVRSALLDSIKESLQQVLRGIGTIPKPAGQTVTTTAIASAQ
jgi:hypothetical protein